MAILEKFRGMLAASECVQISMEAPGRINPTTLEEYLHLIERLEERTNTTIRIQKGAQQNKLQYQQENTDEYDSYNARDNRKQQKMRRIAREDGDEDERGGWVMTVSNDSKKKQVKMIYQGQQQQPTNGNGAPYGQIIVCTYCAKVGHAIERCQKRRRDNGEPVEPNWECRICKQRGVHYTLDCPDYRPRPQWNGGNQNGNGQQMNQNHNQQPQQQQPPQQTQQQPQGRNEGQQAYHQNGGQGVATGSQTQNGMGRTGGVGCYECGGPHLARDCQQKRVATNNRGNYRPSNSGGYQPASAPTQGNYRRP
jgi:hypothetical protein